MPDIHATDPDVELEIQTLPKPDNQVPQPSEVESDTDPVLVQIKAALSLSDLINLSDDVRKKYHAEIHSRAKELLGP